MQQAQPKSAATREDAAAVRSLADLFSGVTTMLSTSFAANLNPKVIQARLGHSSITETMDTYGNSQELHQPGEKLQVSSSQDRRNGVPLVLVLAL